MRALAAAVLVAALGGMVWVVGQARYLEDYCLTRAPLPSGGVEMTSVRGPSYTSPVHLRCDWAERSDVVVLDPLPALGALAVLVVALAAGWFVHRRTRRGEE